MGTGEGPASLTSILRILQDTHCQPSPPIQGTQCEDGTLGHKRFSEVFPGREEFFKNYKMTDLMIKNHALPLTLKGIIVSAKRRKRS